MRAPYPQKIIVSNIAEVSVHGVYRVQVRTLLRLEMLELVNEISPRTGSDVEGVYEEAFQLAFGVELVQRELGL